METCQETKTRRLKRQSSIPLLVAVALTQSLAVSGQSEFQGYLKIPLQSGNYAFGSFWAGNRPGLVNNAGQWLGHILSANPSDKDYNGYPIPHVAVLSDTGLSFPFGTDSHTYEHAINDKGMILGYRSYPKFFSESIFYDGAGAVIVFPHQRAVALNNRGDILLQDEMHSYGFLPHAQIRHFDGTLQELTALSNAFPRYVVNDLNDRGDVVGFVGGRSLGDLSAVAVSGPQLFLLRHGTTVPIILGHFTDGSSARINNVGQIVIQDLTWTNVNTANVRAYFWDGARLHDIAPGSLNSHVRDFNDSGELLVETSDLLQFLFRDGVRLPLAPLVFSGRSNYTSFIGISDSGNIYGIDGTCPLPAPCSWDYVRSDPPLGASQLQASVIGSQVALRWNAPTTGPTVTSYLIEAGSAPGKSDLAQLDTVTPATSAIPPPGEYFLRVRARSGGVTGRPSNEVVVKVGDGCHTSPEMPRGLNATVTGTAVNLTWLPVPSATSYVLAASGAANLNAFDTGSAAPSFRANPPPGTYFVYVRARNACGTSVASSEITVVVGGCPPPQAPTGLSANVNGSTVTLSWQSVAAQGVFYVIEAGSNAALADLARFTLGTSASLTVNAPNGRYYVRVRAQNTCGLSSGSNEIVVTVG